MASTGSSLTAISERYASALYDLADDSKKLDLVADDLRGLKTLLNDSDDLRRFIGSPLIDRAQQAEAMAAVIEKTGADDLTRRFVGVLGENRRLFVLPQVIDAYLATLAERRGEVTAYVTTAVALTAAQEKELAESLNKGVGGKTNIVAEVDPSLLGGMVVRVGSRMVDTSIRTQMQKLRLSLKAAG